MEILKAAKEDLSKILELQKIAYISEAELHNDYNIQPLTQTIEELEKEYENCIMLKLVDNNEIVGSIRAYEKDNRVYVGKLIVHPDFQNKRYGTRLLNEIETYFDCKTFELFTSSISEKNLYLYKKNGYKEIKQEKGLGNIVFVFLEKKKDISLIPLTDEDIDIFKKWLNKEYIYKWFCPDGETEKDAWLDEVKNRNNKYTHYKHFIVTYNDIKIGYCIFFDCHYEQEYSQEFYDTTFEENYAYEIGFCIGEEEYLNKGIGKIIIKKLEEEIIKIGGKLILADPSEKNTASIKALLNNGFKKCKDNDYRKEL